jgi:hypothetical protein
MSSTGARLRSRFIFVGLLLLISARFSALYLQAQQPPQLMPQLPQTRLRLPQINQPSALAAVSLPRLAGDDSRSNEIASLHSGPGLRWQRTSPTAQQPDGPVLYTIIIRSSATANYVPKISGNYTLTNSLIFDNGTSVAVGNLSIAADGTITFKSGQAFPGTGTITAVNPGTKLIGGGSSGSVTLGLDAATNTFVNSFGLPVGFNYNGSTGGAATYCIIGQLLLFPDTINGLTSLVPADGRILPIAGNSALFSLIGPTFGGNGTTNFAVPDMRSVTPKNMTYHICVQGTFP